MKRNGFVFIETIIAIVVLTGSLLLIYSSFTHLYESEKVRVYYDDAAFIYRTHYLRDKITSLNIMPIIRDLENNEDVYFHVIGMDTKDLFLGYESEGAFVSQMIQDFAVKQMIILKNNKIDNLKKCSASCSLDKECSEFEDCNYLYLTLDEDFINYLKTIYVEDSSAYILAVSYHPCENSHCQNFYSWVSV